LLAECRVAKTDLELQHLCRACLLSSMAHVYVMRHARPGLAERQLEALFQGYARFHGGCRHMSYTCICGSGPNGAILHYGHAGAPNDQVSLPGAMMVLDMGGEYAGYATDITCSYPNTGRFSADQRAIYQAVLAATLAVEGAMRPGVWWPDMHQLAERTLLTHLAALGLVRGAVDDMMAVHLGAVFMPHGLGHFLGLNVHDVGGFLDGAQRQKGPGIEYLRTARYVCCMLITNGHDADADADDGNADGGGGWAGT
jgi:Xaa-Pro dipeptidase